MRLAFSWLSRAKVRVSGLMYGDFRGVNGSLEIRVYYGPIYYLVDLEVVELLEVF